MLLVETMFGFKVSMSPKSSVKPVIFGKGFARAKRIKKHTRAKTYISLIIKALKHGGWYRWRNYLIMKL